MELSLGRRPSLAEVRWWARGQLAEEPSESVHDVLLVVNELVGNAYRYTTSPSCLRLVSNRDMVRVEVVHDPRTKPMASGPGPRRPGGLMLVARVAERWGVERKHGGTTVWADIPYG